MIDQETEEVLPEEVLATEIQEGLYCTMQFAMNVARIVKYPSGQAVRSQYIAVTVLRRKAEAIVIDQETEEVLPEEVLATEIQEGLRKAI
ncbi:MAG TPA: hypothetical protein VMY36_02280 [Patescibacteria group bacterium]|nr:hypothetical protein [Patescibacteria group bacterium]